MKVVILAGGYGTRLSEETEDRPKPMLEIGGKPILWHIMKLYSAFGFNEFIVCLGYKGYMIKEYFADYYLHMSDVTFDIANNQMKVHNNTAEPWVVTLVDTGLQTMTGGRVKRIRPYLDDETFMLTYGDGVADVDMNELLRFHKDHGKMVTVTAVQPEGRFGGIEIREDSQVSNFIEKPHGDFAGWINGGFFVCEPEIIDLIENDSTMFEREPLEQAAQSGNLHAYRHHGFWKGMDTLRDKRDLNDLWDQHNAPWMARKGPQ